MAKGKGGSGKTYVSKGIVSNVKKSTLKAMRKERTKSEKFLAKQKAYLAGKNPWITIENPNTNETNKRFIRVRMNDMYGNPKERAKKSFQMAGA